MNIALKKYSEGEGQNFEDIHQFVVVVKDHLNLLTKIFHKFDDTKYFTDSPLEQLHTLNMAVEFVQQTQDLEKRFMHLVKRLKAAYDICSGSEKISQRERDYTHFYLAVRSIIFKLTRGGAPDIAQMNAKVREMIKNALESDGIEEIYKLGDQAEPQQDIFDEDYLKKIEKIKLLHTKIKLLQKLLAKAISDFKKINKIRGVDFTKKMQSLVERYNERSEDIFRSDVIEDFTEEIIDLYYELMKEQNAAEEMGIDIEVKAFYDILKAISTKYDFTYPEEKLLVLAEKVKSIVDDKTQYVDWNKRNDIRAGLQMELIITLDEHGYPPITHDEAYQEIIEQAENFKRYQGS